MADRSSNKVIGVEVMADHGHLLVEVPPAIALSGLVKRCKGNSWRPWCQEFPHRRRLGLLENHKRAA